MDNLRIYTNLSIRTIDPKDNLPRWKSTSWCNEILIFSQNFSLFIWASCLKILTYLAAKSSRHGWTNNCKNIRCSFIEKKQVCIPVGCVPPACCPYLPACAAQRGCVCYLGGFRYPGGCLLLGSVCYLGMSATWGVSATRGGVCYQWGVSATGGCLLPRGCLLPGGVCYWGVSATQGVSATGGCLLRGCVS